MAGIWLSSRGIEVDNTGSLAIGATARFFDAGTTTPRAIYRDQALTSAHPNPLSTDAFGRWPAVYTADGFFRVVVTTSSGSLIRDDDYVPALGSSSGGGTPPSVDTTKQFATLDFKWRPDAAAQAGWVRANGRTIGAAASGGTERANADCEALFLALWNHPNRDAIGYSVVGGAGASAAADWAANKQITLPDLRFATVFGVGDMGSTTSSRVGSLFTADATTAGKVIGVSQVALSVTEMPAHDHGAATGAAGSHSHTVDIESDPITAIQGTGGSYSGRITAANTNTTSSAADHTHTITSQGGGAAHSNMPPGPVGTWWVKL